MANIKSTTARLRRAFQYPDESSDSPDVMDEEEQERLIGVLATTNSTRNQQFRKGLCALPALAAVPFVLALSRAPVLAALALTSLASTMYLLWRLAPDETGVALLDAWGAAWGPGKRRWPGRELDDEDHDDERDRERDRDESYSGAGAGASSGPRASAVRDQQRRRRQRGRAGSMGLAASGRLLHRSPLEIWLPYLNLLLGVVVLLLGVVASRDDDGGGVWLGRSGLANLPLVLYLVVLVAKTVMASVDPERELGDLTYEYKGA